MNVAIYLVSSHGPLLELAYVNESANPQYLAAPRVEPGTFDGSYFQFNPTGIPFRGIQVKRGPYLPAELITLDPGDRLVRVYDLSLLYDLPAGSPVQVRYRATHPLDGIGQPSLVESSWLSLTVDTAQP